MRRLSSKRFWAWVVLAVVILVPVLVLVWQWRYEPGQDERAPQVRDRKAQIERGEYLARAGDCLACHTARGGETLAGGRVIPTPFGQLVSPNITPDEETGIGRWSADDFWRALHNGRGRNGEFLYPAFPYPNYTRVTREDADAIFAWLRSRAPVKRSNPPHSLRFPYNQRMLLAFWRALYFRPDSWRPDTSHDLEWNRGAYLVQGLGHCNACHASRNFLGATPLTGELTGGLIPMLNWYAPSLSSSAEGLGHWRSEELAALMKTGVANKGATFGPMAEVVRESLQYLSDSDLAAMSSYIKSLPQQPLPPPATSNPLSGEKDAFIKQGAALYEKHCVDCHGKDGRGHPTAYPPLLGNGSVMTPSPVNAIRMVLNGGFPPSTAGNPRPYGMPPFGPFLSDAEVAAVVSYVRTAWGNRGGMVSAEEVARFRTVPVD